MHTVVSFECFLETHDDVTRKAPPMKENESSKRRKKFS